MVWCGERVPCQTRGRQKKMGSSVGENKVLKTRHKE